MQTFPPTYIGNFHHILPAERQKMVDDIVRKLQPELENFVKHIVGNYAITEEEVGQRVMEQINEKVASLVITVPLTPRWFARWLFCL